MPRALIIGIAGQDGYYLSKLLYGKGYEIHGVDCNQPTDLEKLLTSINIVDITQSAKLRDIVQYIKPDETYFLAAHHFSSQERENKTDRLLPFISVNLLAVDEILQLLSKQLIHCRFFYASSSHVYGIPEVFPQTELTPHKPHSPYGISKSAALHLCRYYRETYGVYASVGIMYNHESQRRGASFVTTQIAHAAALAYFQRPSRVVLKSLDAVVDWGAAEDYVHAMWLTLQHSYGDEYIIASGIPHTVRDFAAIAFSHVGLNADDNISQDESAVRSTSVPYVGDPAKIKRVCGWNPSITFYALVCSMVDNEIRKIRATVNDTP